MTGEAVAAGERHAAQLRAALGQDAPLWLPTVTGVVLDRSGTHTLLVRRPETGLWAPVAVLLGPAIEPADAIEDAVLSETGERVVAEHLVWVQVTRPLAYSSGARAQYLNLVFRLRGDRGQDSSAAVWFPLDALPGDMGTDHRERISAVTANRPAARFGRGGPAGAPGEGR